MDDEASPQGGLGANGAPQRPRWGRRTPYGIRRDGDRDERRVPVQQHAPTTYAALDLGTNNCRLLVARPTADGFRVIDAFSRIIRLGEGVAASGRISEAAFSAARSRRSRSAATRCAPGTSFAPGSLPRRPAVPRRTARSSAAASPARRVSNWRSSIPLPRRGSRRPAAPNCSIRRHQASSCSISAVGRRNWCGSIGALATAGAVRRRPTSSAGLRCRSASSRSPSVTAAMSFRAISTTRWWGRSRPS